MTVYRPRWLHAGNKWWDVDVNLTSNGMLIPHNDKYFGRLVDSSVSESAEGLRANMKRDGYVLLRGLLPRASVNMLRASYMRQWRNAAVPTDHGTEGHPAYDFARSDEFKQFADSQPLRWLARILLETPVRRLVRTPIRHFLPGSQRSSRAHIDGTYLDSRAEDAVTMWIPIGDCTVNMGSLIYLERSHEDEDIETKIRAAAPTDRAHDNRPLTHDLKWMADFTGRRWLSTDFEAGDVIAHSPLIIHASTDTIEGVPSRVSTDIRFCRKESESDPRWNDYWSAKDGY